MLFGQSLFQSVVDRLEEEAGDEEETDAGAAADFRIRGLGAGFVTPAKSPAAVTEAGLEAYLAVQNEAPASEPAPPPEPAAGAEPEPEPEPPIPPHLLRLSEAEIAEDLAISPQDDAATLAEKRRRFAKLNHPDRVAAPFRDHATTRMTTANLLIDRATEALFWR